MTRRITHTDTWRVCVIVGLFGGLAPASSDVIDLPFEGVVVQEMVRVRAGAGYQFYVVGELRSGDRVRVDEVIAGWFKIVPPPKTFSFVSKAFVDTQGEEGKVGVISKDRTPIWSASVNGPAESYRRQLDLMKDDSVQVVGEVGSYYRIRPPKNTFVFVSPGSVRPASKADLTTQGGAGSSVKQQEPATPPSSVVDSQATGTTLQSPLLLQGTTPHDIQSASPSLVTADPALISPLGSDVSASDHGENAIATNTCRSEAIQAGEPASVPNVAREGEKLAKLGSGTGRVQEPVREAVRDTEEALLAALEQPLEEQPLDDLLARYNRLAEDPALPSSDQRIVRARLAHLNRNLQLAAVLEEIARVRSELTPPESVQPAAPASPGYGAVGQLLASGVYDGGALPRLYRLVEPSVMRTIVYVRPGPALDPKKSLGNFVGLVGQIREDPVSHQRVMEVERVDVLEPTGVSANAPGRHVQTGSN